MILATSVILLISGCGGGGGGGGGSTTPPVASITLSGTAAVGTPIVGGSVSAVCTSGGTNTAVSTDSNGAYSLTLSGQTAQCALELSGGTINGISNNTLYHSIAISAGIANITPLTDLVVANMAQAATPSTWFSALKTAPTPIASATQNQVTTALYNVSTALSGLTALTNINPITTSFSPTSGNVSDDMLTALSTAMTNNTTVYAALLTSAATTTFTAPTGLNAALTTAYASTTSGSVPFTVGGSISGLAGTGLVLQNNGSNATTVTANGSFTFSNTMTTGSVYRISVQTQPAGQSCSIANGTGTVNGANSTNISVSCVNVTLACPTGIGGGTNGVKLYNPSNWFTYALSTTSASVADTATVGWGAEYTGTVYGAYTGSLQATLWAVSSSYSGGTITGDLLGTFSPDFQGTGAYSTSQIASSGYSINTITSSTSSVNPSAGQYCLVLALEQYMPGQCTPNPNGYCIVDWMQFSGAVIFK